MQDQQDLRKLGGLINYLPFTELDFIERGWNCVRTQSEQKRVELLPTTSLPLSVVFIDLLHLARRNVKEVRTAYDDLGYDTKRHTITLLPLDLSHLATVKEFAKQTLETLGDRKIDYLMMIAGLSKGAKEPGINGSQLCEPYIVNHLCRLLLHRCHGFLLLTRSLFQI